VGRAIGPLSPRQKNAVAVGLPPPPYRKVRSVLVSGVVRAQAQRSFLFLPLKLTVLFFSFPPPLPLKMKVFAAAEIKGFPSSPLGTVSRLPLSFLSPLRASFPEVGNHLAGWEMSHLGQPFFGNKCLFPFFFFLVPPPPYSW